MLNNIQLSNNVCSILIDLSEKCASKSIKVSTKTTCKIQSTTHFSEAVTFTQPGASPTTLSLEKKKIARLKLYVSGHVKLKIGRELSTEDLDLLHKQLLQTSKQLQLQKENDSNDPQQLERLFLIEVLEKEKDVSYEALTKALERWVQLTPPLVEPLPLITAIDMEQWEIAERIIIEGGKFDHIDSEGRSILGRLMEEGRLEFARLVLSKGGSLSESELKNSDLLELIFFGKSWLTKPLEKYWNLENNSFTLPEPPESKQKEWLERISLFDSLLLFKADKEKENCVRSLLTISIWISSSESIKKLLTHLSPNQRENWLQSSQPVAAVVVSSFSTIQTLIEVGVDKIQLLTRSASANRKNVVAHLLSEGTDILAIYNGESALSRASGFKHSSMVQFLLNNGADPNQVLEWGTAAHDSADCAKIIMKKEKRGLSEYLFCLKLIGHVFQIKHQLEDLACKELSLEGMPLPSSFGFKERLHHFFSIPPHSRKKTIHFFSYVNDIGSCFSDALTEMNSKGSSWIESAKESIASLAELESLSSVELEARFRKGEGIPIFNSYAPKEDPASSHGTWMWFEGNLAVLCNSGQVKAKAQVAFVFIDEPSKISAEVIEKLRSNEASYVEGGFLNELKLNRDATIIPHQQKGGFCSIRSFILLMKGIMICKAMGAIANKTELITKIPESKKLIIPFHKHGKAMMMEKQIKKILDLYEDDAFQFKRETSLLLKIVAKAPINTKQTKRLIKFISENKSIMLEDEVKNVNLLFNLKGARQLESLYECFEDKKELFAQKINCISDYETPLICAIKGKRFELVEHMLKMNANPNLPNGFNELPLSEACLSFNNDIASTLLKYGADPLKGIAERKSPIDTAVRSCSLSLLELMLQSEEVQQFPALAQHLLASFFQGDSLLFIMYKAAQTLENPTPEEWMSSALSLLNNKTYKNEKAMKDFLLKKGANPKVEPENFLSYEFFRLALHSSDNQVTAKKLIEAVTGEALLLEYLDYLLIYNDQYLPLIKLIAQKGVTIDLLSAKKGHNNIFLDIYLKNHERCLFFFKNGASPLFKATSKEKTPLTIALLMKDYILVGMILDLFPEEDRKGILKKCHEIDETEAEESDYDAILEQLNRQEIKIE